MLACSTVLGILGLVPNIFERTNFGVILDLKWAVKQKSEKDHKDQKFQREVLIIGKYDGYVYSK